MARLAMCGWESGRKDEFGTITENGGTLSILTNDARSGTYAIRGSRNTAASCAYVSCVLQERPSEIYVRLGVRMTFSTATLSCVLALMDGATLQVGIAFNSTSQMQAIIGPSTVVATTGAPTTWACLEIRAKIGVSGIFQAWLNGVLWCNYSGSTRPSGTDQITSVYAGLFHISGSPSNQSHDIDDLAINDTTGSVNNGRIGQGGIFPLFPNADTADKDFSRSAGSDNYSLVNSFPPDGDASYVEGSVVGDCDLYQFQPIGGAGTVDAVWLTLNGRVVNGAGATVQPTIKSVATTEVGSPIFLTNTYATQGALFETDPNGGIPWTAMAINSAQIGMTVV